MNKRQVTLNLPEGFREAEGEQPRKPKEGDFYWAVTSDVVGVASHDFSDIKKIILEKEGPVYRVESVMCASDPRCWEGKTIRMVEIKALEDCMALLKRETWDEESERTFQALIKLMEGE